MTESKSIETKIEELYQKFLKRKADKTGLYYFVQKVKNKEVTFEDVKNSLINSDEYHSIKNYSHYTDKYWNDLPQIVKYKNKLSTGDENVHWIDDIQKRFKQYIPFDKVLVVGCGNGWLERKLFDMGIGKNFDAFDISEKYIKDAEKNKGSRMLNYFVDDINNLQHIKPNTYDAIFNFAILHHAENLDNAMKKLALALKQNGLIFNEEYVGPARNQYSDKHVELMLNVMADLPEKFRTKYPLRPPLENFRVEPSEAIHSDLVIPVFRKYFECIYEKNLNGGIAYQILWNNIDSFQNYQNKESEWCLNYILKQDQVLSVKGKVPILFWYGVGKPKLSRI